MEELLLDKYGPLMDLEELAVLLRIKKQSLYQQIYREGLDIPHVKRGKKYLFPTQEVVCGDLTLPVPVLPSYLSQIAGLSLRAANHGSVSRQSLTS
jgi:hypothetical protein